MKEWINFIVQVSLTSNKQKGFKMTNLAKNILNAYNSGVTDPSTILSMDIGSTENEVSFIIEQLLLAGLITNDGRSR